MKLLFVHDHKFYCDNGGNYYSSGGLPASTWMRYLKVFDSVDVIGRRGASINETTVVKDFVLSTTINVDFHLMNSPLSLTSFFKNKKIIIKQISELILQTDCLIIRLPSELGLLSLKLAIKYNKPFAVEVVDCPWDGLWNHGDIIRKLYAPFLYFKTKHSVEQSKFSLYVTEYFLQQRYPSPNAEQVSCSNVEIPSISDSTLKRRHNFIENNKGKIVFGLIGTLNGKLKGIQTVLRSLSVLKTSLMDFEFRILSSGDKTYYHNMAKNYGLENNVFFDGSLPSGQPVFDWLDKIDIYLHPSYKEGLPRALIEAMSRGCPCIASNVAGIPELLTSEYLIKAGDDIRLSKLILDLSFDKQSQLKASTDNFERSKSYQSKKLNLKRDQYLKLFRDYAGNY